MVVLVVVWLVIGSIIGFVAGRLSSHSASVTAVDVAVGIAGALAGGLGFNSLGFPQATAFAVAGAFGAAVGSVVLLTGYRTVFRRDGF